MKLTILELVQDTLSELVPLIERDEDLFFKTYKSLPFNVYKEIETLSISKSSTHRALCEQSRIVTKAFHNNKKFTDNK